MKNVYSLLNNLDDKYDIIEMKRWGVRDFGEVRVVNRESERRGRLEEDSARLRVIKVPKALKRIGELWKIESVGKPEGIESLNGFVRVEGKINRWICYSYMVQYHI